MSIIVVVFSFRFADYGVMLEINDLQYLPDGRSFLDCVGGRRFKVRNKIFINVSSNYTCPGILMIK